MINRGEGHVHHRKKLIALIGAILIVGVCLLVACSEVSDDDRQLTIGLATNNFNGLKNIEGFRDGMEELGYIDGENVRYIFADSPLSGDKLDAYLRSLVEAAVDLIFTAGTPTGVAAHRVTAGTGIPVVFGVIADPIEAGVVDDLTRPGGNMTGVKLSQNQDRRLELLHELAPDIRRVLVPYNPEDSAALSAVAQIDKIAPDLGLEIVEAKARATGEVTEFLENFPEKIDAIFLVPDSIVNAHLDELVALALKRKLPMSGPSMVQVEEGALATYGIIHHRAGMQAAAIADQVLKGTPPGEIPIQEAEFFLAFNLQTAQAIGLQIPDALLHQAEVIIRGNEQAE